MKEISEEGLTIQESKELCSDKSKKMSLKKYKDEGKEITFICCYQVSGNWGGLDIWDFWVRDAADLSYLKRWWKQEHCMGAKAYGF